MINHGLVKLYNTKVRKKNEPAASTINYNRFLDICDAFSISDGVRNAYTNRKAHFTSQNDDLILFFKDLNQALLAKSHIKRRD